METVGNRISYIVKKLRLTKKNFAESLNISSGNLSDWINPDRKSNPTVSSLIRINEIYDVNITWLLTGKGEMFIDKYAKMFDERWQYGLTSEERKQEDSEEIRQLAKQHQTPIEREGSSLQKELACCKKRCEELSKKVIELQDQLIKLLNKK